jgi:site-specific DNA-cytosine methylase
MNELALFAGAGGGILGGHLLGWRTICAVEWEPYPASVLMQRQNDGILPPFPIWDDVQTFDGKPWRGRVDVVSGGFPCQDISAAGRGAGIDGSRSGMWAHMARIICEVRPRYVFVENSPMLTSRGLGRVLGDLAAMGYDARWGVLGAVDAGAPHRRDRIWIVGKLADAPRLFRNGGDHHSGICAQGESFSESGNGCRTTYVADTGHLRRGHWTESTEAQPTKASGCGEVGISDSKGSQGYDDNTESPRGLQHIATESGWRKFEPNVG